MKDPGFHRSRKSPKNYFSWRVQRVRPVVSRLQKIINVNNLTILDLGCGFGALTKALLEKKATVIAADVDNKSLRIAKTFLPKNKRLKFIKVNNSKLPFVNDYFDVVFLFDVIEHVKDPPTTISECKRVLKPGGILYVEFTPYYSIVGHHLYDYAKWPIHILPKKLIKQIVYSKHLDSFLKPKDYWNVFSALNKLRIGTFQKLVRDLTMINERFIVKYPDYFQINLPFVNYLGLLKDFFTMSFEGIYRKGIPKKE